MKQRSAPAWRDALLLDWRPYAWLTGLVLVLYLHCLFYGIILLDDNLFLIDRFPLLRDWAQLPGLFKRGAFLGPGDGEFYYRPLLLLSFMIDAHMGGQNPAIYHFSNVAFHAVSTLLVFPILRRILGDDRAFLMAAVFAVHPALANAVAWINGRTDSFLAMFVLACFYCYQRFLAEGRWRWAMAHLAFLALALLSKELAIVVPAACLSYAYLVESKRPPAARQAALALGWLAEFAAWMLARKAFLHPSHGYSMAGLLKSMWSNLPALLVYWGKIVLPLHLSPYPILQDSPLGWGILAGLATLWLARNAPPRCALWGLAWFSIFLLPSFVYPDHSITPVHFEYRLYLPLLGALALLAQASPFKSFELGRPAHALAAAALVSALSAAAWANSSHYENNLAAWRRASESSPHSAFAHKQLGTSYYFRKDYAEAEAEYRKAIDLNAQEPMAHNNLGVVFMSTNRLTQAEEQFLMELRVNPGYDNALYNLGLIHAARGRSQEAASFWERTLTVNPEHRGAQEKLNALRALRP